MMGPEPNCCGLKCEWEAAESLSREVRFYFQQTGERRKEKRVVRGQKEKETEGEQTRGEV